MGKSAAVSPSLFDHIPVGMTMVEIPADAPPRILAMNREASRLYGEGAEGHVARLLPRLMLQPERTPLEWVHAAAQRVLEITAMPLEAAAASERQFCLVALDITSRKRADADLAQARKMRAVGELVGGLAHEFNNLLTPILLKVGEIELFHPGDAGLIRDLKVIGDAARRGADLTRRLLTFGRKPDGCLEPVKLWAAVDACFHLLRSTVDRRIGWENAVPEAIPPLFCNSAGLNQILLNLLLNARDTVAEKLASAPRSNWSPCIRVAARELPPGAITGGRSGPDGAPLEGWQCLTITDNGMGMRAIAGAQAFDPFFATKDSGGTGLGLATVWHSAAEAGGKVEVSSQPGEGTTFSVYLPVWRVAAVTGMAQLSAVPKASEPRLKVLVVEDDPLVCKTLVAMLRRHRHEVETAADGLEAEQHLTASCGYDLVLLDLNLPGVAGREVVRRARARGYPGRILIMSGALDETAELEAGGVDGVLPKPFTPAQLDAALRHCLAAA